jgi:predicted ATPase/class 3 adenylate cyclase
MTNPPPGMITFLCIDVQARAQAIPTRAAGLSLEHYTTILNQAIHACGGTVFKFSDGSVYTAFPTAHAALAAALASYWTMYTQAWGETAAPHVHMALHSGPAGRYSTTYVGPTFNHAVSLLAACRSGQILLSRETHEQIGSLPAGTELRDLGERRLKDLTRPEHIFQLIPHHRPTDLVLNAEPAPFPINLPVLPSPLIGRDREVAEIRGILRKPAVRLLTLLGSSGTGKTRLSLQLAVEMAGEFEDGVYFVPLAPVGSAGLVASAIGQALELKETGDRPLVEALHSHLASRQTLMILDNFEQLIEAAGLIEGLLAAAPELKILLTSQAKLGLAHEQIFPVPPLALPDPARLPPLDRLMSYPSIALFLVRAQVVQPDFALTAENAATVAELCVRLGGIPLAIELVAAYSNLFAPDEMLAQITQRLAAAQAQSGDELTHKQTLHEALGWSYALLGADEQTLLARMGVFEGGCTVGAAEAVAAELSSAPDDQQAEHSILDLMRSLLHKNLLVQEQWLSDEPRYVMLDMIHQFAGAQLQRRGETDMLRRAHATYCLALAEQGEAGLTGAQQDVWLKRLEDDVHNLRAALGWSIAQHVVETALRLSGSLWRFWYIRGYLSEGRRWLTTALESSTEPSAVQTKALVGASVLSFIQGDYSQARVFADRNLALVRELGDTRGIANALNNLGAMAVEQGDYAGAKPLLAENLQLRRGLGDNWGIAAALNNLARATEGENDYAQAELLYIESLELFRGMADKSNSVNPLANLGWMTLAQDQYQRSRQYFIESLSASQDLGYQEGIANALQGLAHLAAIDGQRIQAARLIGVVDRLYQQSDIRLSPLDDARYSKTIAAIQARVDEAAYATAWAEGQTLAVEQIIDAILA